MFGAKTANLHHNLQIYQPQSCTYNRAVVPACTISSPPTPSLASRISKKAMGHASRRAFVLLLAVAGVSNAQTCYYPNGTAAEGNYPCVTDAEHSACCGRNDECLTNGLCRPLGADPTSNEFWRDSCTDRTWLSDACPKYCYNSTTSEQAAFNSASAVELISLAQTLWQRTSISSHRGAQ